MLDAEQYNQFLVRIAEEIDIPPSKYQQAVDRYESVGKWLEGGDYPKCIEEVSIYPQGSFKLGTVTRPLKQGKEANFDIDLVCELPILKNDTTPHDVKDMVRQRLLRHKTYAGMLDEEGKRCWTLNYAEQDGIGFHLDVLPAVPDIKYLDDTSIAITNKGDYEYSWSASNPRGYAQWFYEKNTIAYLLTEHKQKLQIQQKASDFYASIDEVPDQLVRTPLQRAIQLMKRHRDERFNLGNIIKNAPISMIITTLAAHLYQNETDVLSTLQEIITKLQAHAVLLEGKLVEASLATKGLIQLKFDGTWYIGNPVNPDENFADRWHEDDHAKARAFFDWVRWLHEDYIAVTSYYNPKDIEETLTRGLGAGLVVKHLDLLGLDNIVSPRLPHIHISSAPKPWKRY